MRVVRWLMMALIPYATCAPIDEGLIYHYASSLVDHSHAYFVRFRREGSHHFRVIDVMRIDRQTGKFDTQNDLPGWVTNDGSVSKVVSLELSCDNGVANLWIQQDPLDPQFIRACFAQEKNGTLYFQLVTHSLWLTPLNACSESWRGKARLPLTSEMRMTAGE